MKDPVSKDVISETPQSERPRERCLRQGAQSLSLRECLALVLGSGPRGRGCLGVARDILERPGQGLALDAEERAFFMAMELSPEALLQDVGGLGDANRAKLLATFELARRYIHFRENRRIPQASGKKSELGLATLRKIPTSLRMEAREWLGFIPYYRGGKLGSLCVIERGVRTHVNIEPAELFARLLALRPAAFFLVHNHPSGDLTPSEQDFDLTRRISQLSRQFGISLLGHWIVAPEGERLIGMEIHARAC